jgi:hypothetical protein
LELLAKKRCGESQLSILNNTGVIDSVINDSRESIKDRECLLEIEAIFEKPSDAE